MQNLSLFTRVSNIKKLNLQKIAEISPQFEYWKSNQTDDDEFNRLLKLNKTSKASYLFKEEPYKWEILFQSIAKEIAMGDINSIKGMQVILDCLKPEEKNKVLDGFKKNQIFESNIIEKFKEPINYEVSTKKNIFRFIRILFSIFTNTYNLEIRRERKHLYEKTGFAFNYLRKAFNSN